MILDQVCWPCTADSPETLGVCRLVSKMSPQRQEVPSYF